MINIHVLRTYIRHTCMLAFQYIKILSEDLDSYRVPYMQCEWACVHSREHIRSNTPTKNGQTHKMILVLARASLLFPRLNESLPQGTSTNGRSAETPLPLPYYICMQWCSNILVMALCICTCTWFDFSSGCVCANMVVCVRTREASVHHTRLLVTSASGVITYLCISEQADNATHILLVEIKMIGRHSWCMWQ